VPVSLPPAADHKMAAALGGEGPLSPASVEGARGWVSGPGEGEAEGKNYSRQEFLGKMDG